MEIQTHNWNRRQLVGTPENLAGAEKLRLKQTTFSWNIRNIVGRDENLAGADKIQLKQTTFLLVLFMLNR